MSANWDDFRNQVSDRRFLLPLSQFVYNVDYVAVNLEAQDIRALANMVTSAVLSATSGVRDFPLSSVEIRFGSPTSQAEGKSSGETAYFTVASTTPVYDFVLQVGPTTFRMTKSRTSLQDLFATLPIFDKICRLLFGAQSLGSQDADRNPDFCDIMRIKGRIYRVIFDFSLRLTLGTHITEPNREATNVEVMKKLIATTLPMGGSSEFPERNAPLAALLPEHIWRTDVDFAFSKTFGDKRRGVWIGIQAPYNITQKDIDIKVEFRCGDTGIEGFTPGDLVDWKTPIDGFYRDLIASRFLPALFHDIVVEPRL